MKRTLKLTASVAAVLALILMVPTALQAQNPNFSGSWTFNAEKSQLPTAPGGQGGRGMGGGDMTIAQQGNSITITTTRQGREGPTQQATTYTIDGQNHEVSTGRGTSTAKAEWKDGSLVITNTRSMGDRGEFTTTETYTLKENGRVLEVSSQMPGRQGGSPTAIKRVYDKKS